MGIQEGRGKSEDGGMEGSMEDEGGMGEGEGVGREGKGSSYELLR